MTRWWLNEALFYAPPDGDDNAGDGGGGPDDGGKAKDGKGKAKDPVDELRAVKDREIQQEREARQALEARLAALEARDKEDVVISAVQAELDKIDRSDPDAVDKIAELTARLARNFSALQTTHATDRAFAIDQAASYRAALLAQEHGGEFEAYKAELAKARTLQEMDLIRDRIDLRLQKEASGRQGGSGRRTSVDDGRGSAASDTLRQEMDAIDVTTPEGQAEWAKKEDEFFKRAKAAAAR